MAEKPQAIQKQYPNDTIGEAEFHKDISLLKKGEGVYQFPNGKSLNAISSQHARAAIRMGGQYVRDLKPEERYTYVKKDVKMSVQKEIEYYERERDRDIKELQEKADFKKIDAVNDKYEKIIADIKNKN